MPSYVVRLGNMTAWELVSHNTDTDFVSLTVEGPNGQIWSGSSGPNVLHHGNVTDWALSSVPITVPSDAASKLKMTWSVINHGHNGNEDAIKSALQSAGTAISQQNQGDAQTPSMLQTIIDGINTAVGWLFANCDCAMFSQTVVIDGAQLSGLPVGWSSEGADQFHAVYDYKPIVSQCKSDGHYNLEVHIHRSA